MSESGLLLKRGVIERGIITWVRVGVDCRLANYRSLFGSKCVVSCTEYSARVIVNVNVVSVLYPRVCLRCLEFVRPAVKVLGAMTFYTSLYLMSVGYDVGQSWEVIVFR